MPKYIAFYKPHNVLSTFTDEADPRFALRSENAGARRATLKDYVNVPDVYAAGRLDKESEGLLLLTDDGALIHRLTDPRYEHPKTYHAQVEGVVTREAVEKLRAGVALRVRGQTHHTQAANVEIISEPNLPARAKSVRQYHPTTWLKMILREGKKHQIRHMTAAVGFPTLRLVRIAIGGVTLGDLKPGEWRELTKAEVKKLKG